VAGALAELGLAPWVVDAREARAKARRVGQKSDRRDAFELADGLRRGQWVTRVWVPPAATQRLRRVLSRRRHFVRVRGGQVNAAKFLLRSVGLSGAAATLTTAAAWEKLLARPGGAALREHLALHARLWGLADALVRALDRELDEASAPAAETVRRLATAPGIGRITAATFAAVIGDAARFPSAHHAASYAGLVPSTYDSGERERHGRITRRGSGELRAMLCEAAQHAARPTHPLHPYFARQAATDGAGRAVVAVAHRLCRILWAMEKTRTDFDPARLGVVPEVRHRTKTTYWRRRRPEEALA
jgi:transposase